MRRFLRFIAGLSLLLALAAAAGYFHLRQSLPKTEGEIRLRGLGAAAGVLAHRRAPRALDARGLGQLGEDDGLGPGRQLAQRVAAHATVENAAARAHPRAAAALPRRAAAGDRRPKGALQHARSRRR